MVRFLLLTFSMGIFNFATTQNYDHIWYLGSNSQTNPDFAGIIFDFFSPNLEIYSEFRVTNYSQVNASINDSLGNMLFYTNGIHIANGLGEIMENGDSLNPGYFHDLYEDFGYILGQGAIAFPAIENDSLYLLLHLDVNVNEDFTDAFSEHVYLTTININTNNFLGTVIEKNKILVDQKLDKGKITAVKHANGRDWWVLVRRHFSNQYIKLLISTDGVRNIGFQTIGDSIPSGSIGQAVFSPDGQKYVQTNLHGRLGDPIYINIYDFDRCSGLLSNPVQFSYVDSAACLGAAVSPNSRFLYVPSYLFVYQYDLWADDIEASRITVAEWDGFADNEVFSNTFYLAQLAPNGKIYINSNNGTRHLHVINQPDSLGLACDVCQHCVDLPSWNSFSMPNFPNYRLYHEEGSPCDTLRQPPTAGFSFENNLLQLAFDDNSTHDIRSWQWDFGNGNVDSVANPVHTYEEEGVYEVCLTVANPRGEDVFCEQINVMATGVEVLVGEENGLVVFPNPAKDEFFVKLPQLKGSTYLQIFDAYGRLKHSSILWDGNQTIAISVKGLPSAVYFLQINIGDGNRIYQKVVVE